MNTLFKLVVVMLALFAVTFLIQTYANSWFHQVAFTAPIIGTMSYAACAIVAVGCVLLSKLHWGK